MHKILNRTHRPSNINLLKARDYYFDKARVANNRYGKICMLTPIILTVVGMLAGSILSLFEKNSQVISDINSWLDSYLDAFVGITSVIAFIANLFIDSYVGSNMEKSNVLREEYDCRVFNIDRNPFWDNSQQNNIPQYEKKAAFMPDRGKYEVWYREIFSSDDFANAICLMMDNAIYTYHVYKVYRKKILRELICIAIVFALYSAWYLTASVSTIMVNPFILFLAVFDEVKELVESYFVSKEQEEENYDLIDFVKNNKDMLMHDKGQQKTILRSAQDVIYSFATDFSSQNETKIIPGTKVLGGTWQQVTVKLNDFDRLRLTEFSNARIIVVAENVSTHGIIYAGPWSYYGNSFSSSYVE